MVFSTVLTMMSWIVILPLLSFAIAMFAISSVKVASIRDGGIRDENNIWN